MDQRIEERCAQLINACRDIRILLGPEVPDQDADALATELAARGVDRKDRAQLVERAKKIEQAFYEEPDPA